MGATTIWERWDGVKPDGDFQNAGMNSFNHYAYGAIGDWMYRVIGGIDTYEDGPGYRHSRIEPRPGGGLTYANCDLATIYGKLSSHWRIEKGNFYLDVLVPVGTTSEVCLPDGNKVTAGPGAHHYAVKSANGMYR